MKTVGIPLILTFQLDPVSQERLDAWRARYFPRDRNHLKAHLTIFHQLPGQEISSITRALEDYSSGRNPFPVPFERLTTREGFVGIGLGSEALTRSRDELSGIFSGLLRAQDKKIYKPHVTIANLGSPRDAKACLEELEKLFTPWEGMALGLDLYHYRGGPWEFEKSFPFTAPIAL